MKKFIIVIFILSLITLTYANDFSYEKLSETNIGGCFETFGKPISNEPYIYFPSRYGLQTFLIHENGDLERISILPVQGELRTLVRKNNFLYISSWVIEDNSSILYKVDISDPSNPEISDTMVSEDDKYESVIKLSNQIAHFKSNNQGVFLCFINPQTMEDISQIQFNNYFNYFEISDSLFAIYDEYNQTNNTDNYNVYNISDPINIVNVGELSFPIQENESYCNSKFQKIGANLFVSLGIKSITYYNISDSLTVQQLSHLATPQCEYSKQYCTRKGDYLLIPGNLSISIFNIHDISNPTFVAENYFPQNIFNGFPEAIVDTGNYLYMGANTNGILKMVFNDGNLEFTGFHIDNEYLYPDCFLHGNKLFLPIWNGGIKVFDITNPANPIFENKIFPDKEIHSKIIFPQQNRLILSYKNNLGLNFLAKYDISDVNNPNLLYEVPLNYSDISLVTNPEESNNIIYILGETYPLPNIQIEKYDFSSDDDANLLFLYNNNENIYHYFISGFFKNSKFYLFNYNLSLKPLVFSGFAENNPEFLGQVEGINPDNLGISASNYCDPYFEYMTDISNTTIHYLNINNLTSQEMFTTASKGYNPFSINDNGMLLTRGYYTINIYDTHNCSTGNLAKNNTITLNSDYPTFTILERNGIKYLYVIQAECISVYSYNITANGDISINPLNDYVMKNYPNPFNPTTTISFDLPKSAKVDLSIYNIKGQKVKTLTDEKYPKGKHSLIWNGTNDENQNVGSGMYFYKLNVNGKNIIVKKCLLLK